MGALTDFLSGRTVYTALDRAFEKLQEPRYRRKAQASGFGQAFEDELQVLRDCEADHASVRAFMRAKRRASTSNHGA